MRREYYQHRLPPVWYSRLARFVLTNKDLLAILLYILIFFVTPIIQTAAPFYFAG